MCIRDRGNPSNHLSQIGQRVSGRSDAVRLLRASDPDLGLAGGPCTRCNQPGVVSAAAGCDLFHRCFAVSADLADHLSCRLWHSRPGFAKAVEQPLSLGFGGAYSDLFGLYGRGLPPVSYTHRDVYKRQIKDSSRSVAPMARVMA